MDGLGCGVQEFVNEGDLGYVVEEIEDESNVLEHPTPTDTLNY